MRYSNCINSPRSRLTGGPLKLACFHPASVFCAWSVSTGLVDTLRRMGHEVSAFPIDATAKALNGFSYPTAQQLRNFDGIVLSGPEHMREHLFALYPDWNQLRIPRVSWLHETVEREDYKQLPIAQILKMSHAAFCPAAQDEKHGMRWLPFGVDTEVFKPDWSQPKEYDVAFIGLVYPKRAEFLKRLAPCLKGINLITGNVQVMDLRGVCVRETAALYAENLRKIKVFVNLPSLSQLAVTKIFEVQACGTFLITPAMVESRNLQPIQAHFYDPGQLEKVAESIRFCLEHETERVEATRECCARVLSEDRLEKRCEVLLKALEGV